MPDLDDQLADARAGLLDEIAQPDLAAVRIRAAALRRRRAGTVAATITAALGVATAGGLVTAGALGDRGAPPVVASTPTPDLPTSPCRILRARAGAGPVGHRSHQWRLRDGTGTRHLAPGTRRRQEVPTGHEAGGRRHATPTHARYAWRVCATYARHAWHLALSCISMMHNEVAETRTLAIVLPEAEWRALRAQEPDAIGWIQAQIKSRIEGASAQRNTAPASVPAETWDDY
jgi:hypothetical protein